MCQDKIYITKPGLDIIILTKGNKVMSNTSN